MVRISRSCSACPSRHRSVAELAFSVRSRLSVRTGAVPARGRRGASGCSGAAAPLPPQTRSVAPGGEVLTAVLRTEARPLDHHAETAVLACLERRQPLL